MLMLSPSYLVVLGFGDFGKAAVDAVLRPVAAIAMFYFPDSRQTVSPPLYFLRVMPL